MSSYGEVGSLTESGRCLTQRWNATGGGWVVPDKIVEKTICKLSYQFYRSLLFNDLPTLREESAPCAASPNHVPVGLSKA